MPRVSPRRCRVSPRIVVRAKYVRLGAVLLALETSKTLRDALRAVHELKVEEFTDTDDLRAKVRALRRERRALRAALRPIVEAAYAKDDLDHDTMNPQYHIEVTITVAEARAAKKALASKARGARRKA